MSKNSISYNNVQLRLFVNFDLGDRENNLFFAIFSRWRDYFCNY